MGLFVVRELAAQHGISVRLRQRLGGGGTTATVQLPPSMVTLDLRVPMDRAADSNSGSAGWTGTEEQLPLQVSVIDESIEGELFSPSSISPASLGAVTSQCSQPRTAQQECLSSSVVMARRATRRRPPISGQSRSVGESEAAGQDGGNAAR